jgi:adenosine kinase
MTAALPKKNAQRARVVVFTQGADETILVKDGKVHRFAVEKMPREKIVDTTGAGDAFTGGFLSQYVQGESLEKAVAAGHYVASVVIQRSGPSYPDEPHSFKF